jgi:Tol biopolymer transport system component
MHRYVWLVVAVLALAAASPAAATFPGSNGALVFGGLDGVSHTTQVYRVGPNGTNLTRVTTPSGQVFNECPSWAADGRLIYFDRFDRSSGLPAHIYRINASGGSRELADDETAPTHLCPTVNRTGTRITAIEYADNGSEGIISMNSDGSDRQTVALAGANQDNYGPQFAPSGSRILFNQVTWDANNNVQRSDLLIVDPPGMPQNITQNGHDLYTDPSWSPDASTILAVRGAAGNEIVRMSANGSNIRALTEVTGATLGSPTFSPDGSKIAFTSCVGDCGDPSLDGTGSLWVMNADGSGLRQILAQATAGVQPDGSLDWGVGAAPPRCLGRRATIVAQSGGGLTRGTPGNDVIVGSRRADPISSGGGRDLICSRGGDDRVKTGAGADRVLAGPGDDRVTTGAGADSVRTGGGHDRVSCGAGNDRVLHVGADRLSRCERVRRR